MYIQLNNVPLVLAETLAQACREEIAVAAKNAILSYEIMDMAAALNQIEEAIRFEKEMAAKMEDEL